MVETRSTAMEVSGNSSDFITKDELRAALEESFDSRMGDFMNNFQRMLEDILQKDKLHVLGQDSVHKYQKTGVSDMIQGREQVHMEESIQHEEKVPELEELSCSDSEELEINQEIEETCRIQEGDLKLERDDEVRPHLEEEQTTEPPVTDDYVLCTTLQQVLVSESKSYLPAHKELEVVKVKILEGLPRYQNGIDMKKMSVAGWLLGTDRFKHQKASLIPKSWKFKFKNIFLHSEEQNLQVLMMKQGLEQCELSKMCSPKLSYNGDKDDRSKLESLVQVSLINERNVTQSMINEAEVGIITCLKSPLAAELFCAVDKSLFPRRWKFKLIDRKGSNEEVGTVVWYETQFSSKRNWPLVRTEAETLDSSKQFRGYRPGVSISIDSEDDRHKLDGQHKKAIQELYIGLSIGNYHVVEVNRDAVKGYDAAADVDKFFLQCLTFQQEEVAMYKASNVSTEMEDSIGHLLKTTKGSDGHILEKTGLRIHTDKNVATFNIMRVYFIGSVVSGVGSAPLREATAQIWVDMINEYEKVALVGQLGIQIIYGIDAVHGPNVYNVTILSHSVDLGATRDPDLVKRIGAAMTLLTQATVEVRATETPYTFTLCFAVCRDPRWDRCYEGYNEDHKVVEDTTNLILGLQEEAPSNYKHGVPFVGSYDSYDKVASCAQLYVGDGGVTTGINENNTVADLRSLLSLQMSAYTDAIYKASSTMMVSYSSWNGEKMCQQRKDVSVEFCYGSLPRPPEITWVAVLIFVNIFQLELHQHWLCCYRFSTHQSLGGLKFKWEVLFCFGSLPRPPEIAVDTFAKEPERILEIRRVQRKGRADAQVLIKWKKYSSCEPRGQGSLGREDLIQIITSAEDPLS